MNTVGSVMNGKISIAPPGVSRRDAEGLLARRGDHYLLILTGGRVLAVVCSCQMGGAGADAPLSYRVGAPIFGITEGSSLEDAASSMRAHGVGCLPVYATDGRLRGLVTRRDLRRTGMSHEAISTLPWCAACHGDRHVRTQDPNGDSAICAECDDGAHTPAPEAELGAGD